MSKQIHFELVSPEEKLVSKPVYMAVIPGTEGEMGIGADHASFVVALKPGIVQLFEKKGAKPHNIFIAGGFADINGEHCVVLAEEAHSAETLKKIEQDLLNRLNELTQAKKNTQSVAEKTKIEEHLDLVRTKISAAKTAIAA